MNKRADWILGVLTVAVVGLLIWFANLGHPVQFAGVTEALNPSLYIDSFVLTGGGHVDQGSVPLQATGMLAPAGTFATALELDTQPSGQSRWQKQSACCQLLGNSFTGSASLSVASARAFDFELVSVGDNNNTERYSIPHMIEKKKRPRAASNASW